MKLYFFIGIPASGKTTERNRMVDELGCKYINKDEIAKKMVEGTNRNPNKIKETLLTQEEYRLLELYAAEKADIIYDNTNTTSRSFNRMTQWCKEHGYIMELRFFNDSFNLPLCVQRNGKRENPVPLYNMFSFYQNYCGQYFRLKFANNIVIKNARKKAIIFDIDGTLALMKDRSPYEWSKVGNDAVNYKVLEMLNFYKDRYQILIVSARDGICYPETKKWLEDNNIYYDKLILKGVNDNRKDVIVKMELYANEIYPYYDVYNVFDDRQQIVYLWRGMGLTCFQVNSGFF